MVAVYRAGLGPTFLEVKMLATNGALFSGMECVATTDADGASPPVTNCYWIREITTFALAFEVGPGGAAVTPLGFEWPVIEAHRVEGTLSAAGSEEHVCRFDMDGGGGSCILKFDPLSSGTFRHHLLQVGGNDDFGSTFDTSTNYSLRFQFDGTNIKLWVNGVLDITIASSDKPTRFFHSGSTLPSGVKQYWCGLCWRGSNDEADRPNTTLTIEGLNPASDNETADYGDQADCITDGVGQWQDWDDDGADDSDTSIYLCELGGANGIETSELDNLTMTTPKLVVVRQLGADNVGGKTVSTWCRILDGDGTPNVIEIQHTNIGSLSFRGFSRAFPTAPDGGAWTQAEVNDLKAGIRTVDSNGSNDHWAMMRVEVFDLGDDPPSVIELLERSYPRGVGRGVLRGVA